MLKNFLLLLLVSLAFDTLSICAETINSDSLFVDTLALKFEAEDPRQKSSIIDHYIDDVGVTSNEFMAFITRVATPYDFSQAQKNRIFDTASTKYDDTRIITFLNYFKESAYIPVVKKWFAKSDKRGKFLYESSMIEFGDKEIADQWLTTLREYSKANKTVPMLISQYFPVICRKFPNRKYCDCVIDFLIDHQNQYFVIKDYTGNYEYYDVVYYLSFFLTDRLKGFPDAFMYNKFERTNENKRWVSFSRADKDIIIKWCKMHRRDYDFDE